MSDRDSRQQPDASRRSIEACPGSGNGVAERSSAGRGPGLAVEAARATDELLSSLLAGEAGKGFGAHAVVLNPTAPSRFRRAPMRARRLGPYRLLRVLGEGGMGTVHEAEHVATRRRVALKVLRGGLASDDSWRRFQREAGFLGQLDHPGIARVFETGLHEDGRGDAVPWIAMELIDGLTISRHADERELAPKERIDLILQACDAVSHAHDKGIVHRDLKPDNILVDGSGRVRVLDFSVARAMDEPDAPVTRLTLAGDIVGTLSYMSPEQACGRPEGVDERSDVYALGVLAFELLSGRLPVEIEGLPLGDALGRIRDLEPERLRASCSGGSRDLDVIVGQALEKDPDRRYASVAELAADLRRYLSHEPILARPPSAAVRLGRFARRNAALVGAVLGVMLTLAAAVVVTARLAWSEAAERRRADETAARALEREQDALRAQYRAQLAAARAALDQGDAGTAGRLLAEAPLPYRGWEWRQLDSSLDESLAQWSAPEGRPIDLVFAAGGGSLLVATTLAIDAASLPGGELRPLWRAGSGEELRQISADGERALVQRGRQALLLDLGTGESVLLDEAVEGHLVFTDDGRFVHLNSRDASGRWTAVFLDARSGAPRWRLPMPEDPKGFWVAGSCLVRPCPDGSGIDVWDAAAGGPSRHHDGPVVTGILAAAEGRLIVGTEAGTGHTAAWERGSWRQLPWEDVGAELPGVAELAFTSSGKLMAATHADGVTRLRDGETGRLIAGLAHADLAGLVPRPALHEQAGLVAVADAHHAILVASTADGAPLRRFRGHSRWLKSLSFSPDGSLLASLDGSGRVRLWDLGDLSDPRTLTGHESYVYGVAISPDGTRVASAAWDGTTRLWDLATGRPIATLKDSSRVPYFGELGWSPDGERLVSVHGHLVSLWDARAGALVGSRRLRDSDVTPSSINEPVGVAWHPGGEYFVVGSVNRPLHVYASTEEGGLAEEELWPMLGEAVDFSPDGRLLAVAAVESVEVWDVERRERVLRDEDPTARTRALAFSPDGGRLAAVSDDSFLRMWSIPDGRRLVRVHAHGDQAHGLAWSPDGTRLATGGSDRVIRIWDPVRAEELAVLHGHELYAYTLDWSPDGRVLVSGSGDGTVRLWEEGPLRERLLARRKP